MCRIDGPFGPHSLTEKTETTERFLQALDECGVAGDFRRLLEKHFLLSWPHELGSIEKIEAALETARHASGLPEKITSFVQAIKENFGSERLQIDFIADVLLKANQENFPFCFAFAQDVASEVFPDSIYGFYKCFKGSYSVCFEVFVLLYAPSYYGEFCHLSPLLFNDSQIDALGQKKREDLLWAIFDRWFQGDCSFIEHLTNVFVWDVYSSVPTLETLRFKSSFEYLSAWIKADTLSRDHSESLDLLEGKIHSFICERKFDVFRLNKESLEGYWEETELERFIAWAGKWLDDKRHEATKVWCCSAKLRGMPPEVVDGWARRAHEIFLPLCSDLSKVQAEALIGLHIKDDLKKWVKPEPFANPILENDSNSRLWYVSPYRDSWRLQLVSNIEGLPYEDRLRVLSRRLGVDVKIFPERLPQFIILPSEKPKSDNRLVTTDPFYGFPVEQEDQDWWDSLLRKLSEETSFPRELYPLWAVEILTRLGVGETFVPLADKSLGIIRGDLNAGNNKMSSEQVGRLLKVLEKYAPEKAVRHRLMLLRASRQPFAKETLDIDRESLCPQSMSEILSEFLSTHIDHSKRQYSHDEWADEEVQFLASFRTWFSDYCLGRLRLRKKEKVESDSYRPDQVVEQSPVWRQAYLKALSELSVDLQGQVHKTVYFTRNFDPDEAVRSVAKECYKAVRREKNKSQSANDIRRGLIAAYWWLLLAQRQELGDHVNYEEARLTRRRLLRR